jgi:hypothetical protein
LEFKNRNLQELLSKQDGANSNLDDQTRKMAQLELQNQALTLERDELLRSKKDREAKLQDMTRKYLIEKENAQ